MKLFKGLLGDKKQRAKPLELEQGVKSSIYALVGSQSIPQLPSSAQRAFQLATDPNAEVRAFVDVIEGDEALSARVIKIANSVYFERGKSSKTVAEAASIIGLNELRSLLASSGLFELFPSRNPLRPLLWRHDIAVGIVARELATRSGLANPATTFLAGLLHDIGKLLLLERASDLFNKVITNVKKSGCEFFQAELDIIPFDHSDIGLLIAERWSFDNQLRDTIKNHHQDFASLTTVGKLIATADAISYQSGYPSAPDLDKLTQNKITLVPQFLTALGIALEEQANYITALQAIIEKELTRYE
jgi:putative nucleotidyltransferase with HDIG domain